ncbi:MAG: hypothetical protein AAB421_05670 [Patescibacteria group bacterium]
MSTVALKTRGLAMPEGVALEVGGKDIAQLCREGDYVVRGSIRILIRSGVLKSSAERRTVQVVPLSITKPMYPDDIDTLVSTQGLSPLTPEEFLTYVATHRMALRLGPRDCYFSPVLITMSVHDQATDSGFRKHGWLTVAMAPNRDRHLCIPDRCAVCLWTGVALTKVS